MMPVRTAIPVPKKNLLWISWHDSNWIPILNPANVMDYFCERSNPFYEQDSNNEILRMQRQSMEQLNNMIGTEYILLHVQEPILYVVRKQHRHSPTEATPLADYYIIAGVIYQAPDLTSVFNSRILSTVHHLQEAFEEASGYSRYHPSKGYSWDFSSNKTFSEKKTEKKKEVPQKEEPSSIFQRKRVDMLLTDLMRKFPQQVPVFPPNPAQNPGPSGPNTSSGESTAQTNGAVPNENGPEARPETVTVKQEPLDPTSPPSSQNSSESSLLQNIKIKEESKSDMKPPPEKKMKL